MAKQKFMEMMRQISTNTRRKELCIDIYQSIRYYIVWYEKNTKHFEIDGYTYIPALCDWLDDLEYWSKEKDKLLCSQTQEQKNME